MLLACYKNIRFWLALFFLGVLVGCGGGGGSAGSASSGSTSSGSSTSSVSANGDTQSTATASISLDIVSGGISKTEISALEIAQARVVVKDSAGKAVPGLIVTFSETDGTLLTVLPTSKTALTGSDGVAFVEIRASSTTSTGATSINAAVTVANSSITAKKSIAISSAPVTEGVAPDPQQLSNALNFIDVSPADKSIVLQGSGGNGRTESATLRFRVVDKNNTPVKGTKVDFKVTPSDKVTLNIPSAISDSDGIVVTTVSSKNVTTALVVTADITRTDTSHVISQSDQITVTTGVGVQAGFDLSASKYNLNSNISGDSSTITVRVVDQSGNRVADGLPVVFTATHGAVGSSARGGCTTLNGACTVDYIVQNPRPADGSPATVTASTQVNSAAPVITDTLNFKFINTSLIDVYDAETNGNAVTIFDMGTSCLKNFEGYVGTPAAYPPPAAATVAVTSITDEAAATIKIGGAVPDQLSNRHYFAFSYDLTAIEKGIRCTVNGSVDSTARLEVKVTSGASIVNRMIDIKYKSGPALP